MSEMLNAKGREFWFVPESSGLVQYAVGVVNMDALVWSGVQRDTFARLWVQGHVDRDMSEYRRVRRCFLRTLASQGVFDGGTRFVGTDIYDVDLMEYDRVVAVCVHEAAMSRESSELYGDPYTVVTSSISAIAEVKEAADEIVSVLDYTDLPGLVGAGESCVGALPDRLWSALVIAVEQARQAFRAALLAPVAKFVDGPRVRDAFQYVRRIRHEWQDAVARVLEQAPQVDIAFCLPACVLDSVGWSGWCAYKDAFGMYRLSDEGIPMVSFLRLTAGAYTLLETAGTWLWKALAEVSPDTVDDVEGLWDVPGLCYLLAAEPGRLAEAAVEMEFNPVLADVFGSKFSHYRLTSFEGVYVKLPDKVQRSIHFTRHDTGLTLDDFSRDATAMRLYAHMPVGGDPPYPGSTHSGWTATKELAWFGDVVLLHDARLIAMFSGVAGARRDGFVQGCVSNVALATYVKTWYPERVYPGAVAPHTLFEASYKDEFRRQYLRRVHAEYAERVLTAWTPSSCYVNSYNEGAAIVVAPDADDGGGGATAS